MDFPMKHGVVNCPTIFNGKMPWFTADFPIKTRRQMQLFDLGQEKSALSVRDLGNFPRFGEGLALRLLPRVTSRRVTRIFICLDRLEGLGEFGMKNLPCSDVHTVLQPCNQPEEPAIVRIAGQIHKKKAGHPKKMLGGITICYFLTQLNPISCWLSPICVHKNPSKFLSLAA